MQFFDIVEDTQRFMKSELRELVDLSKTKDTTIIFN